MGFREGVSELRICLFAFGGQSLLNLPAYSVSCALGLRNVDEADWRLCHSSVYPSYNIHDDLNKPSVLLCSYTVRDAIWHEYLEAIFTLTQPKWTHDAQRIGSLVNSDSPRGEEELKGLVLYNLALLHSTNDAEFKRMHHIIKESYITHHVSNSSYRAHLREKPISL